MGRKDRRRGPERPHACVMKDTELEKLQNRSQLLPDRRRGPERSRTCAHSGDRVEEAGEVGLGGEVLQIRRPCHRQGIWRDPVDGSRISKSQLQVFNCFSCPYLFMVPRDPVDGTMTPGGCVTRGSAAGRCTRRTRLGNAARRGDSTQKRRTPRRLGKAASTREARQRDTGPAHAEALTARACGRRGPLFRPSDGEGRV